MLTLSQLLEIDLGALALVSGSLVLLLRQGLKQGRAKRALENSLASAQAPIAITPFVASRSLMADAVEDETGTEFFAAQPVADVSPRHPVWSDVESTDTQSTEQEQQIAAAGEAFAGVQTAFPADLLLPANEVYFAGDSTEVPAVLEEQTAPELPREHVGILFLEDECDLASLKLAEITELAPRTEPREAVTVAAVSVADPAPVEFIDGLYADPIDGMPFTPGEEVTPCACGTAYRLETAVWLRAEANGECVQCHRKLTGEVRRIPEDSTPELMAVSA